MLFDKELISYRKYAWHGLLVFLSQTIITEEENLLAKTHELLPRIGKRLAFIKALGDWPRR